MKTRGVRAVLVARPAPIRSRHCRLLTHRQILIFQGAPPRRAPFYASYCFKCWVAAVIPSMSTYGAAVARFGVVISNAVIRGGRELIAALVPNVSRHLRALSGMIWWCARAPYNAGDGAVAARISCSLHRLNACFRRVATHCIRQRQHSV